MVITSVLESTGLALMLLGVILILAGLCLAIRHDMDSRRKRSRSLILIVTSSSAFADRGVLFIDGDPFGYRKLPDGRLELKVRIWGMPAVLAHPLKGRLP